MDGRRVRTLAAALVLAAATVAGIAVPVEVAPHVLPPPPGAGFDYQLGGDYPPVARVQVVERDSTSTPTGRYDICYVNGFQTQPQDAAQWRREAPRLLLHISGAPYRDPGWPDEYLLDVSTAAKRTAILRRIAPTIRLCAAKGFDAVEIDNLDSWTRSRHAFGIRAAIAMARSYARVAHSLGLAIAQKNGAGHSARLKRAVGFDFAITEECVRYRECGDYLHVHGQRVYDVEYGGLRCAAGHRPRATILRDRELRTPASPGYIRRSC